MGEAIAKYGTYLFIGAVVFFFFAMFIAKGKKAEDIGTWVAGIVGIGVCLLIVGGGCYQIFKSIF